MENTIPEKIKTTVIFFFAMILALTFTASSLIFIVKNYGDKEEKREIVNPASNIAVNYEFAQKSIIEL